jgi:hypothetical protein
MSATRGAFGEPFLGGKIGCRLRGPRLGVGLGRATTQTAAPGCRDGGAGFQFWEPRPVVFCYAAAKRPSSSRVARTGPVHSSEGPPGPDFYGAYETGPAPRMRCQLSADAAIGSLSSDLAFLISR